MKIVNKLEIITVVTLLSLVFSNQTALSQNNKLKQLENTKNQENNISVSELANREKVLVSSRQLLNVNDSSIILPIPQPLGILCLLGMAGVGSFLKLKIAKVKYNKKVNEDIETTDMEENSIQVFNH
ncbi:hypothetical protein [Crocosphaera sp.]|uniref:hypothetical protein n=1 Tax=Crocosphaera sp. TaxID=2729996 RepID=UPI00260AEAE4|nr:hypothetical protein [Crocosphaera sp.]MDJ0583409.1 hypothetical protein [Crocosphaera sp.]